MQTFLKPSGNPKTQQSGKDPLTVWERGNAQLTFECALVGFSTNKLKSKWERKAAGFLPGWLSQLGTLVLYPRMSIRSTSKSRALAAWHLLPRKQMTSLSSHAATTWGVRREQSLGAKTPALPPLNPSLGVMGGSSYLSGVSWATFPRSWLRNQQVISILHFLKSPNYFPLALSQTIFLIVNDSSFSTTSPQHWFHIKIKSASKVFNYKCDR